MRHPNRGCTPLRAIADFVRCRDLTCRFPGCDRPATHCDLVHAVPHPVEPIHASNIECLCGFHYLLRPSTWALPGGLNCSWPTAPSSAVDAVADLTPDRFRECSAFSGR